MIRHATLLPALFLATVCATAHAGENPAGPVAAEVNALRADVAALQAVKDRLLEQVKTAQAADASFPICVTLNFADVLSFPVRHLSLDKGSLSVTLRYSNGKWIHAVGSVPYGERVPYFVEAPGLKWEGDPAQGALKGEIRVDVPPARGKAAAHYHRAWAVIEVNATVAAGQVQGTFRTAGAPALGECPRRVLVHDDGNAIYVDGGPLPPRAGALTGTVRVAQVSSPPANVPPPEGGYTRLEAQYAAAEEAERSACELYRHIQALAAALDANVRYEHAYELTPPYLPVRPRPSFEVAERTASGRATPDLDDIGGLAGEDHGARKKAAPAESIAERRQAADAKFIAAVRPVRAHVASLRRAAEGCQAAGAEAVRGSLPCPDPEFGPWFGEQTLCKKEDSPNVLPAGAGGAGPQQWHVVGGWRGAGPFAAQFRDFLARALPELPLDWSASYSISGDFPKNPKEKDSVVGTTREPFSVNPGPNGGAGFPFRMPWASYYATAEVVAPEDQELWAGLTLRDSGALWLNGRLVWTSPSAKSPLSREETYLLKLRFVRGSNRLLLRSDTHAAENGWFALRVCTRGQPRPAAEAQARQAAIEQTYAKLEPPGARVRGWRGDWSGRFPDAQPPLAWDIEKRINVLWDKPMSFCHAMPVIVGGKVFTSEEPQTLVCLDKLTGKELWRHECDAFELKDEAQRKKAAEARAAMQKAQAELAALGPNRDEQMKALQAKGLSAEDAKKRHDELSRPIYFARKQLWRDAGVLGPAWGEWTGQAIATPVTDGAHIWVKYNTGVLACLDLDGNRKWMVAQPGPIASNGHTPSPLLLAGKLIIYVPLTAIKDLHDGAKETYMLVGYDAATGKELWRTPTDGVGETTGTPVPLRLTNGADTLDVVVTPDGAVVRAEDGKLLRHLAVRERYGSPISDGRDTVYFAPWCAKAAVRLVMLDRDTVGAKTLWHVYDAPPGYDAGDYLVLHEGRVYNFGRRLNVFDQRTGEVQAISSYIGWTRPGRCYPALAVANNLLYVSDLGHYFGESKGRFHPGCFSVLTPGPDFMVLTRNQIGRLVGGPVCDGDRLYMRHWDGFTCIGYTGDAGRAYEAEVIAHEMLTQLFPDKPSADAPLPVKSARALGQVRPPWLFLKMFPDSWHFAGPFPLDRADALRAELTGSDLSALKGDTKAGFTMPIAKQETKLPFLCGWNRKEWIVTAQAEVVQTAEDLKEADPAAAVEKAKGEGPKVEQLNVLQTNGGQGHSVNYYLTTVRNDYERLVRLACPSASMRVWIGGTEVRHNQVVRLPAAVFSIVLEVTVGEPAKLGPVLLPVLWPSAGGETDQKEWLAGVQRRRPYLEPVLKASPASDAARRVREFLAKAAK